MPVEPMIRNELSQLKNKAEHSLKDKLLPFWTKKTWDEEYGGFLARMDRTGECLDASQKIFIMQVRMLWSLSAAHSFGITDRGYIELAHRAFDYIIETMWDRDKGGFSFSVAQDGKPINKRKNTDFHAYALTGLSEYYCASQKKEALIWANKVFDLLIEKAGDREFGFIEDFDEEKWPVLNSEQMNLGDSHRIKTIDLHTNIMEGFTYLARASEDSKHLEALQNVFHLIVNKGIHPEYRCGITAFDYDWNPVPDIDGRWTTSYGLNVELAWLLLEAVDLLNFSRDAYRTVILGLIDHAMNYGFDRERGGLAAFGPMKGHVLEAFDVPKEGLLKVWWEQAEMLNALAYAYEWTKERHYYDALIKLFQWIWTYQIDHEYGGWYLDVDWSSGKPSTTDKGAEWKTAFHSSRALIQLSRVIDRIL